MRIPKYRRHPNGQAFVQHRSIDRPGHRLYLGKHGTRESRDRYAKVLAEIQRWEDDREGGVIEPISPGNATVGQICERYLDHAETYYGADSSSFGMIRTVCLSVSESFCDVQAADFGPLKMDSLRNEWIKNGLARVTCNAYTRCVVRVFRWATKQEICSANVWTALKAVEPLAAGRTDAPDMPEIRPATWEEVDAILPHVTTKTAAMLKIQFLCGMRPQDVCRLRVEEIDRSGDIWLFRPAKHKSKWRGQKLTKAIPLAAQKILWPLIEERKSGYLFRGRRGEYLQAKSYAANLRRAIQAAQNAGVDVKPFTVNQLRHGIATLVSEKIGAQAAQRYLGHKSLNTTNIYTEATESELVSIARKVDELFTQEGQPPPPTQPPQNDQPAAGH